ncbi:hypothetical protein V5O48_018898, partial [Marasmius crinis-equi]
MDPSLRQVLVNCPQLDRDLLLMMSDDLLQTFKEEVVKPVRSPFFCYGSIALSLYLPEPQMFPEGFIQSDAGRAHFSGYGWLTPQVIPLLRVHYPGGSIGSASSSSAASTPPTSSISTSVPPVPPPPSAPPPHPISHDFALPVPPAGSVNDRRVASFSCPSSDQPTSPVSNVLARARSTAQAHSYNPAATPVDNSSLGLISITVLTWPVLIRISNDTHIPEGLADVVQPIHLARERLGEVIHCAKR